MKFLFLVLFLLSVLSSSLVDSSVPRRLHYDHSSIPLGWRMTSDAVAPDETVEFSLVFHPENVDRLSDLFSSVSDPLGPDYQRYLSIDEIASIVAPKWELRQKLIQNLAKYGIKAEDIKDFADSIEVRSSSASARKLFGCRFQRFVHSESGRNIVRGWGEISLPMEPEFDIVAMINGVASYPIPRMNHRFRPLDSVTAAPAGDSSVLIVPQSVWSFYSVRSQNPGSKANSSLSVAEFEGESFSPSDLAGFGKSVALPIRSIDKSRIVGFNNISAPTGEATLDVDMIAGVNMEADLWFWAENNNGWLHQFATHLFNTSDAPLITSLSYGWYEGEICDFGRGCNSLGVNSTVYAQLVNVQFQKIGLRGLTLMASSGDSGANGRTNDMCLIPQTRAAYPASSPFITAVGATQVHNPVYNLANASHIPVCQSGTCPSAGQEVAVSYSVASFASGGGFSAIFPMPDYQKKVVKQYLASNVTFPPASYFNRNGRALPDIAAFGFNCAVYMFNYAGSMSGTSCSSPIAASIMALLNEDSIRLFGRPLGFLNPMLYAAYQSNSMAFQDITIGDNVCTEDGCGLGNCKGFYCAPGFDAVTGLGSPNYQQLKQYLIKLKQWRTQQFGY